MITFELPAGAASLGAEVADLPICCTATSCALIFRDVCRRGIAHHSAEHSSRTVPDTLPFLYDGARWCAVVPHLALGTGAPE